jgi:hypothetical protein
MIDFDRWFPHGKMHTAWRHAVLIDYHSHNPWAVCFASLSPHNEMFVWWEYSPNPEKFITYQIAMHMAGAMGDYRWFLALIDPLAENTQNNTGTSVLMDLNKHMIDFRREGICNIAVFETWNTKGTEGRERMRARLANSLDCEIPFNNKHIDEYGRTKYLDTIWISDKCIEIGKSLKNWSLEQWVDNAALVTKDRKETPTQKWSHYCTALEAVLKDARWIPPKMDRHGIAQPRRQTKWARQYMRTH